MVITDRGEFFEPKPGHLGESDPFGRDGIGKDDIESGDTVAGDKEKIVSPGVNVPDFALVDELWLKIFPVTLMEGAYIDYQALPPSEALTNIFELTEAVKNVDGTFISIWHNHTVSETDEFRDWKKVHDQMIQVIR